VEGKKAKSPKEKKGRGGRRHLSDGRISGTSWFEKNTQERLINNRLKIKGNMGYR